MTEYYAQPHRCLRLTVDMDKVPRVVDRKMGHEPKKKKMRTIVRRSALLFRDACLQGPHQLKAFG